jgi:hypothetical protein
MIDQMEWRRERETAMKRRLLLSVMLVAALYGFWVALAGRLCRVARQELQVDMRCAMSAGAA